ncbi:MAG: sugar transferase, partial [Chloroflexi bacterium]|nr:sugar transferase [Chloroflexota bacterium]
MDMAVAGLALLVLAPVMLLIAIAIRLESEGPVLFRQERIGLGGKSFTMYKFRSMRADRRSGGERRTKNRSGDRRRTHKSVHDPRVTVTGKFIRRTSLDELPQLWNVLRGDMSLIGPRPELPKIVARYAPWQHYRHVVRPGITGWWQVNGRSDRPLHENTEIDLYYIEHLSL